MNETIIEADITPALFLRITNGRIYLIEVKISANGLIIMTKNRNRCEIKNKFCVVAFEMVSP